MQISQNTLGTQILKIQQHNILGGLLPSPPLNPSAATKIRGHKFLESLINLGLRSWISKALTIPRA